MTVHALGQKDPTEHVRGAHEYVKDGPGPNQGHYEARASTAAEYPKVLYRAGQPGESRVVSVTVANEAQEQKLLEIAEKKKYVWVPIPNKLPELEADLAEGRKLEEIMAEVVPGEQPKGRGKRSEAA